jgi:hypothetical protein
LSNLYLETSIVGKSELTNFLFEPNRPARHCRICGDSFQPVLARDPHFSTDKDIQLAVEILLQQWSDIHNNRAHSAREHLEFQASGRFMTPEAALRLIPLGIIPLQDMVFSAEHVQAGLEAKRAPTDDVPDFHRKVVLP